MLSKEQRLSRVTLMLREAADACYYGTIEIKMEKGNVTFVRLGQGLRPEELRNVTFAKSKQEDSNGKDLYQLDQ